MIVKKSAIVKLLACFILPGVLQCSATDLDTPGAPASYRRRLYDLQYQGTSRCGLPHRRSVLTRSHCGMNHFFETIAPANREGVLRQGIRLLHVPLVQLGLGPDGEFDIVRGYGTPWRTTTSGSRDMALQSTASMGAKAVDIRIPGGVQC